MLTSLLRLIPRDIHAKPEAEDIFTSALDFVFIGDAQNLHGDVDHLVGYKSPKFDRELILQTADVNGETERRKFAHYVWNAGVLMAVLVGGKPDGVPWLSLGDTIQESSSPSAWWITEEEQSSWHVEGNSVLELGAGAGLGAISCVLAGAARTVVTDYPAPVILDTIRQNIVANIPSPQLQLLSVEGHTWGDTTTAFASQHVHSFQHVLAADCLWMPHEHDNLLRSMSHFLSYSTASRVHVIAGFHTGRAIVAAFFHDALPKTDLECVSIWESHVDGGRRVWEPYAAEEDFGTRKKWLVVATLKRTAGRCPTAVEV